MYWAPLYWLILFQVSPNDLNLQNTPLIPQNPPSRVPSKGQPAWATYFPSASENLNFRSITPINDNNDPDSSPTTFTNDQFATRNRGVSLTDQAVYPYSQTRVPAVFRQASGFYDIQQNDVMPITTQPPPWFVSRTAPIRTTWRPFIKISSNNDDVFRAELSDRNNQPVGAPSMNYPFLDEQMPDAAVLTPLPVTSPLPLIVPPDDGLFRYDIQRRNRITEARQQLQRFYETGARTRQPILGPQLMDWGQENLRQLDPEPESDASAISSTSDGTFSGSSSDPPGRPVGDVNSSPSYPNNDRASVRSESPVLMDAASDIAESSDDQSDCPENPRIPRKITKI